MPHLYLPRHGRAQPADSAEHPLQDARHPRRLTLAHLFDRTLFARCALLSAVSLGVGYLLLAVWLPSLSTTLLESVLTRHLPSDVSGPVAWLRLTLARLPVLCLLAAAGMTRFSGGLSTAVLGFRGLSDGAALCLAIASLRGTAPLPDGIPPRTFLVALCLWIALDTVARTTLAAEARRFSRETASALPDPTVRLCTEERARLRFCLWRYAAFALAALLLTLVGCGVYLTVLG